MLRLLTWAFSMEAPRWVGTAATVLVAVSAFTMIVATIWAIDAGYGIIAAAIWAAIPLYVVAAAYAKKDEQ